MPEQIFIPEFVRETWDDFKSPTTSSFAKLGDCRNAVAAIEEVQYVLVDQYRRIGLNMF